MAKYRVLVDELSYPTDPAIIKRLMAGENVPWVQRGVKHVKQGQIVDDIPSVSIAGLVKAGRIELVADDPPVQRVRATREEVSEDDR